MDITPIFNAYIKVMEFIISYTRYFFYILVAVLYPLSFYRYFISKGQTPFNDFSVLLKMLITGILCVMAYWSHANASPPTDPGFVK